MSIRKKVIAGLSWTAGASLFGQLITWGITIIVMRILSPSDYGLLAIASIFVAFFSMMAAAGLGPAIVQASEIDETRLKQLFGLILGLNLVLFLSLFLSATAISVFFDDSRLVDITRILALQFLINAFSTIPEAMLGREMQFKKRAFVELTSSVCGGMVTLLLAMNGFGVWSLVGGNVFNVTVKAIGLNIAYPSLRLPTLHLSGTRQLLQFGGNIIAARLLWFFYSQADMFIAGKLLGKEAVGFYSVAMHLASLPVQKISGVLNQVAFPAFSRVKDDPQVIASSVLKGIRILSFFSFPVLWGMSAVAPELVTLLLGSKWNAAILPLQLLPLIMPLRMISNFLPSAIDAVGRPDVSVKNLVSASIVLPVSFIVGSQWGVHGLCYAWLIGFPLVFGGNLARILPVLQIEPRQFIQSVFRPAISAVGMYLAVFLLKIVLPAGLPVALALPTQLVIAGAMYLGCTLVLNREGLMEVLNTFKR